MSPVCPLSILWSPQCFLCNAVSFVTVVFFCSATQNQAVVTAYFSIEHLLPFDFTGLWFCLTLKRPAPITLSDGLWLWTPTRCTQLESADIYLLVHSFIHSFIHSCIHLSVCTLFYDKCILTFTVYLCMRLFNMYFMCMSLGINF